MNLQKEKSIRKWFRILMAVCFCVLELTLIGQTGIQVHAQGTATVSAASGKIRASADTSSEVLASVKQKDKLDVISQTTDSEGYTWYKVYVDGTQKGYIRADLLSDVSGTISTESASDASDTGDTKKTEDTKKAEDSSADTTKKDDEAGGAVVVGSGNKTTPANTEDNTKKAEDVTVSPSTVAAATVKGSTVRVRETPSTSGNVKGNAKEGTEVTVSGEATDADGKTWYQVSFNSGDSTINGFIRSDFLEVTQTVETQEETQTEEEPETQEAPKEENNDYELHYEANDEGTEEWFLYDNLKGTKQSLNNILEIVQQSQDEENSSSDQLQKMKIVLIVLAAVILLLVIGITILLFKVRDSYEDFDDEDDDDEDDEEEDEIIPVRRRPTKPAKKRKKRYIEVDDEDDEDDEDEDDEDDDEDEEEAVVRKRPAQKEKQEGHPKGKSQDSNWQSKNFLDVDDDMEFEFLDIK